MSLVDSQIVYRSSEYVTGHGLLGSSVIVCHVATVVLSLPPLFNAHLYSPICGVNIEYLIHAVATLMETSSELMVTRVHVCVA